MPAPSRLLPSLLRIGASLLFCLPASVVSAAEERPEAKPAGGVNYQRDVKAVLHERCFACHGALKQEASLRLDTAELIRQGGDSGPAAVPGKPAESELLARITAKEDYLRMPPEGQPLSAEEVAAITAWIQSGAIGPADEQPEADPNQHWAFRVPVRPAVPNLTETAGGQPANPIDAFLEASRRAHGVQAAGTAERSLLLRRLYLDLVGLPPTRAQLKEFLADDSEDAWQEQVNTLLASPHYGERWGRHWLDVWRYTDWYGLGKQLRNSQKHIWHWRDWVVESLNDDTGYDRMVQLMLAADELEPADTSALRATGFLARNYYLFNRTTWLDETIEHTSQALLGLTMNCSKCHDHKYDPLSQVDYYRLRAFFEPHQVRLDALPGETDLERNGLPRVFDAHPEEPTYLHIRGDDRNPDKDNPLTPGIPAVLSTGELNIAAVPLPLPAYRPALREYAIADRLAAAATRQKSAEERITALEQKLKQLKPSPPAAQEETEKKPAAAKPGATETAEGELILRDDFDQANPERWEVGAGTWKFENGLAIQTETGSSRRDLRLKQNPPGDFVATLRVRVTGGKVYQSFGIAFDTLENRQKLVYLSAHAPGPKLQVTYDTGGGFVYPAEGRVARKVATNQWYELQLAVRGTLLNVAIDGKHALAYELPVQREDGRLDLIAFDAMIECDWFELRKLPADRVLVQAGTPSGGTTAKPAEQTAEQLEAALNIARAEQQEAAAEQALVKAAAEADRAQLEQATEKQAADEPATENPSAEAKPLIQAAALAARQHELAEAELALARARQKLLAAAEKDQAAQQKAVAAAGKVLATAREKLNSPGENYPRLEASLKALEGPAETDASRRKPYPAVSTGRRTALARWIASRDNPLTARVAVNHIWMRHFGQPLVDPVNDFGRRTAAPPQQELLDWLAVEFMEHGWSMKHLHRLIVTSQAYQLTTSTRDASEATHQADPDNEYYWRRRPVRMESQVVRDSLLQLAGRLDPAVGGPTVDPGQVTFRRSLYFTHSRDDRNSFLSMFDDADILRCYRREESIVPQQALTLANSRVSLEMARTMAQTLREQTATDEELITAAFETVLARAPAAEEQAACQAALGRLRESAATLNGQSSQSIDQRAAASLIHALLNHNDFIMIR
ncbi:MAG: PSD1 domain-containing protein [Planctomycetaceae bacterium]|nr:PSD1 domain-containing protein [Planctomycetaceae bacterium]